MFSYGIPSRSIAATYGLLSVVLGGCQASDISDPATYDSALAPTAVSFAVNTPTRTVTDVSRGPLTLFNCDGFDAIATFYGTVTTTVFYNASGEPVRLINQYNTNSELANSVTGKKIFGSSSGPDIINLEPNGAATIASMGLIMNFRDEHGRHLVFATGRVVLRFGTDGSVETTFTAGPIDAFLGSQKAELCGALAN